MKLVSDYDRGQYALMLERLNAYENGNIQLLSLLDELFALEHNLEGVSEEWHDSFDDLWTDLEIALAHDRSGGPSAANMDGHVQALKELVQSALQTSRLPTDVD